MIIVHYSPIQIKKNYDNDSNGDACDTDDDNDSILDTADNCSAGDIGWSSNFITDHDGDGCRDAGEDTDDDNDSILDTADSCSAGDIGWVSNSTTDNDGDGCRDAGEDTDDDNDSIDDSADNCRLVANINQTDLDKDIYGDACDIDDDNNGLIDIDTAEKFNQIRYNLAGTSLTTEMGGIGDITGCDDSSRTDGTGCNGYELTANISLVGYEPWQPIGTCVSDNICPISFDSVFDGNNHSISDLRINTTSLAYGVGLFGAVSPNTSLSNIILDNIRITSSARGSDFGALVGFASGAKIHNVLVEDISISAPEVDSIGSLVGNGENAEISLSSIVANTISGNSRTGGLMGDGLSAKISSSSVVADTINGFWHVGGLIGLGEDAKILSSSVTVTGSISNTGDNVGGLVGYGRNANISLSSVVAGTISSVNNKIGGLVGHGEDVVISLSSVVADTIRGIATFILTRGGRVGGVIGEGQGAQISRTSVVAKTITGRSRVGGIAGYGDNARISASSVVSDSISSVSWWTGGFVGIGRDVEISSSSVAMRSISGSSYKGGLMGEGSNASIDSSLVMGTSITATVSHAGGIVGASGIIDNANKDPQSVTNTYWLNNISFTNARPASTNTFGESKTETDLQSPTAFTGIYADWDNAWCDPDTAAYITDSSSPLAVAENLIWDLGTNNQYPVIRCVPLTPAQQRTITDRVLAGESPLPLSSP